MERVVITKLDNLGRGICFVNNKITFVPNTIPNEVVEIKLVKESKKYNEAVVTNFISQSEKRKKPVCPYFNTCDGCDFLHMDYQDTLAFKKEKIASLLFKYAHINKEVKIESGRSLNYRNKINLKVVNKKIGYFKSKTHELVKIKKCLLAKKTINAIISDLELLNISNGEVVIRCNKKDEVLLLITTKDKVSTLSILEAHKNIIGIVVNDKTIYGENYFIDSINGIKYKVSYNSFFQVNEQVIELIISYINDLIPNVEKALDLYCGVGTIGLALSNKIKELYGVEVVENAVNNAQKNAKLNNISNTKYMCGKVESVLEGLPNNLDLIIVDPPRSGLDTKTREFILNRKAKYILYVSCDPLTLARDLDVLKEIYDIDKIKAFDMFPYTEHVECVCVLNLKTLN